eukprot:13447-Eustigmatos_ZCMA.PRE.1
MGRPAPPMGATKAVAMGHASRETRPQVRMPPDCDVQGERESVRLQITWLHKYQAGGRRSKGLAWPAQGSQFRL